MPISSPDISVANKENLRVGVICGGPSLERGISLNSARSLLDHLRADGIEIVPFYVDCFKSFYRVDPARLYSNTPSDFDFKLSETASALSEAELKKALASVDVAFPAIHGAFGEDGELQRMLEEWGVPFVGSPSVACANMFHKYRAISALKEAGFATVPLLLATAEDANIAEKIGRFFDAHSIDRAVVKPAAGGSSIGVRVVTSADDATAQVRELLAAYDGDDVVVEPFCQGREFSVVVLQNNEGEPVALAPSEISVDYGNNGFFDFRRKYLPTSGTRWPCPPDMEDAVVADIRAQAERIFTLFGMRDFVRLDGWLLDDGAVAFTDVNPVSGMEQNSFLFQQGARVGMTHRDVLAAVLRRFISEDMHESAKNEPTKNRKRKEVRILFGGDTAERQVSLMSGTNVWLKLLRSKEYDPTPYFIDLENNVWRLPYAYTLSHTVEEIHENCRFAEVIETRMAGIRQDVRNRLRLPNAYFGAEADVSPRRMTQDTFLEEAAQKNAFVFLALHGGDGENGVWQKRLDDAGVGYNGSGAEASALCIDKYASGEKVTSMSVSGVVTVPKIPFYAKDLRGAGAARFNELFSEACKEFRTDSVIVKPRGDGCSAGVARLASADELRSYVEAVSEGKLSVLPAKTFRFQSGMLELPNKDGGLLLEAFVETDAIHIEYNSLRYDRRRGYVELTVGVIENGGIYHALNPSITVAEDKILSLEEKFQGGTGVNLTPPPEDLISENTKRDIMRKVEVIARAFGVEGYARLDIFYHIDDKETALIEINTLPGLTPSTVIYHQALAENPPMLPTEFLETLIASGVARLTESKPAKAAVK